MAKRGRPAKATAAQRAEVLRLAAEGASVRLIAVQVFGDAGCRGRVERIVRGSHPVTGAEPASPPGADVLASWLEQGLSLDATTTIRAAFDRQIALIAAGLADPSPTGLRVLLDVQRRLETQEQLERMNALTRGLGQPGEVALSQ